MNYNSLISYLSYNLYENISNLLDALNLLKHLISLELLSDKLYSVLSIKQLLPNLIELV
jgi:hypothetical protein